jgi:Flp pilus assembly protein TadG
MDAGHQQDHRLEPAHLVVDLDGGGVLMEMRRSARRTRGGGQALVVMALLAMTLFGFAAIAVDQGVGMSDRRDLQAIADSAALAGSRSLAQGKDAGHQVAIQYLARNLGLNPAGVSGCTGSGSGQCPAGSYTLGNYTLTVADGTGSMDVSVQHTRRTLVAGVLGITTEVTASAARAGSGMVPCVLCVLEPSASGALQVTGSGSVSVTGGNVVVDSTSASALKLTGSGSISTSGATLVVGGASSTGSGSITPAATTGASSVPDPLSALVAPTVTGSAVPYSLVGSSSATINPGIYSSMSVVGSGSLTLNPGIYVLTGTMGVTGSGSIGGTGVLLYFACSSYPTPCTSGQSGGSLQLTGSGSYAVTAPTASTCTSIPATCPYVGLLAFYDRNNTAGMALTGSGSSGPTGTLYAASAPLTLTGSGGAVNSLIVVRTVTVTGSGSVAVTFVGSQNYAPQGLSGLLR